jgi:hypothetical protein
MPGFIKPRSGKIAIDQEDDRLFVAEVRGRQTPTPGERTTLIAAARDVHVFDAPGSARLDTEQFIEATRWPIANRP